VLCSVVLALAITTSTNLAQQVINNSGYIPFDQAVFAFEVESPPPEPERHGDLERDRGYAR
jgi:hypothetical protein